MLLGYTTALQQPIPIRFQSTSKPIPIFPQNPPIFSIFPFEPQIQSRESPRKNPQKLKINAENRNGSSTTDPKEREKKNKNGKSNSGEEDLKKEEDQRPRFNLRWVELLLDPDPENILAVGLTGLLTWASVQIL